MKIKKMCVSFNKHLALIGFAHLMHCNLLADKQNVPFLIGISTAFALYRFLLLMYLQYWVYLL